ncbi:MAG: hypothetical protein JWL59_1600 [Chthoniobacteraceae bacterium]|nr:hypothetical protein [Chthoniobacteraceae bacterium]
MRKEERVGIPSGNLLNKGRDRRWTTLSSLAAVAGLLCLSLPAIASPILDSAYKASAAFGFETSGTPDAGYCYDWGYQALVPGMNYSGGGHGFLSQSNLSHTQSFSEAANGGNVSGATSAALVESNTLQPIQGTLTAQGAAFLDSPNSASVTTNGLTLTISGRTDIRTGSFAWSPDISSTNTAPLSFTSNLGAIDFEVVDFAVIGNLSSIGTLLEIDDILFGIGTYSWHDGTFSLDAKDFELTIDIGNDFVHDSAQYGSLVFRVEDGLVTESTGTGIFATTILFPEIGESGTFSMPVAPFTLDYDLGDSLATHDTDIYFDLSVSGATATTNFVPEPATLGFALALIGGCLGSRFRRRA